MLSRFGAFVRILGYPDNGERVSSSEELERIGMALSFVALGKPNKYVKRVSIITEFLIVDDND